MTILGLDTSTQWLCVAVAYRESLYECRLETGRKLSSLITITLERILQALDLRVSDIDCFVCGLGPGSFTGLRIGVATVKGCAWAAEKKILGISSLDLIAYNAVVRRGFEDAGRHKANTGPAGRHIVPVVDARRGLLYCCVYQDNKGALKRVSPYMLLTPQQACSRVPAGSIFLGSGLQLYKDIFSRNTKGGFFLDQDYWYPQPQSLLTLGLQRIKQGKDIFTPEKIQPLYLYPQECQINPASAK
jgi:tRNA threonylcarbamoyladenosine biosynthesis protein TsaB